VSPTTSDPLKQLLGLAACAGAAVAVLLLTLALAQMSEPDPKPWRPGAPLAAAPSGAPSLPSSPPLSGSPAPPLPVPASAPAAGPPSSDTSPGVTPALPAAVPGVDGGAPGGPAASSYPSLSGIGPTASAQAQQTDPDRYMEWLRSVEDQRRRLREKLETEGLETEPGAESTTPVPGVPSPAQERKLRRLLEQARTFQHNTLGIKPTVPNDCRALDTSYVAALEEESRLTIELLESRIREDAARVQSITRSGTRRVDMNVDTAAMELQKVYRQRGRLQQVRVESSRDGSLLGALTDSPP
jgi:hypothetical protein